MAGFADDEIVEHTLCQIQECFVFKLPPRVRADGWLAEEMKEQVWAGRLRIVQRGSECAILLNDKNDGKLFAMCPVVEGAVERVKDSSRYFVLKLQRDGRHMFIGMAFNDRNQAFDFNVALQEFAKDKERTGQLESQDTPAAEAASGPSKDFSLKQGQKITLKVPAGGASKGAAASRREKAAGGGGGGLLGPPPGDSSARKGGLLAPPPADSSSARKAKAAGGANLLDTGSSQATTAAPGASGGGGGGAGFLDFGSPPGSPPRTDLQAAPQSAQSDPFMDFTAVPAARSPSPPASALGNDFLGMGMGAPAAAPARVASPPQFGGGFGGGGLADLSGLGGALPLQPSRMSPPTVQQPPLGGLGFSPPMATGGGPMGGINPSAMFGGMPGAAGGLGANFGALPATAPRPIMATGMGMGGLSAVAPRKADTISLMDTMAKPAAQPQFQPPQQKAASADPFASFGALK